MKKKMLSLKLNINDIDQCDENYDDNTNNNEILFKDNNEKASNEKKENVNNNQIASKKSKTIKETYPTKELAIKAIKDRENVYLYSSDKKNGKKGSKIFHISTRETMYELSKDRTGNYYENYEHGQPIKLFIDIDYDLSNKSDINDNQFDKIIEESIDTFNKELSTITEIKPSTIILKSNRKDKFSSHIIYNNIVFGNIKQMNSYVKNINSKLINESVIDPVVYNKAGCLRMYMNTKRDLKAPLEYYKGLNYEYKNEKQLFMDCLLRNVDNIQIKDYIKLDINTNKKGTNKSTKKELNNDIPKFRDNKISDDVYISKKIDNSGDSEKNEMFEICELLKILSVTRAERFEEWFKVGMMLKNSSDEKNEQEYLNQWIEFSKRWPKKYNYDACIKQWKTFKKGTGLYTTSSLHYWAKNDNMTEYKKIMKQVYKKAYDSIDILELETHDFYAKLLYELKRDTLVCIKEIPMIWYVYEEGLWKKLDGISKIKNYLINDVIPVIKNIKKNVDMDILKMDGKDKSKLEKILEKQTKYTKGMLKLKNENFSSSVIVQSMRFFKDASFYEKLDSLDNIISLGEYVYNLETCEFRKAEPTDFCSLHTKFTYNDIKELKEEDLEKTYKILKEILYYYDEDEKCEKTELYDYMMNCLPELLMGYNKRQIFYIWTGSGRNGKGLITTYLAEALGDYYMGSNVSLLTNKRDKANAANSELAKLKGCRLAIFSEPDENCKLNNAIMKELTGGDIISTRELYGVSFSFVPKFKPIIMCNSKFELEDIQDNSIPLRLRFVTFKNSFLDDPNPNIKWHKLRNDDYTSSTQKIYHGKNLLKILFIEWEKLSKKNFIYETPKIIDDEKKKYIDNSDEVKVFFNEQLKVSEKRTSVLTLKNLYYLYCDYCKEKKSVSVKLNKFKERMLNIHPQFEDKIVVDKIAYRNAFTYIELADDEDEHNYNDL